MIPVALATVIGVLPIAVLTATLVQMARRAGAGPPR